MRLHLCVNFSLSLPLNFHPADLDYYGGVATPQQDDSTLFVHQQGLDPTRKRTTAMFLTLLR